MTSPVPRQELIELADGAIRDLRQSIGEPGVELGHQRRAEFLADRAPFGWRLAIDAALDVEQGIETLHSVERDRADDAAALAGALLVG